MSNEFYDVWHSALTPLSFLDRSLRTFPDKTAVVHGSLRYTYRQFAERVYRLAGALRAAGVQPGDRVAFLCPNTPPMLEAHFGVPLTGAILVAINTRLSRDEIGYILNHAEVKLLFVDSELAPITAPLAGQTPSLRQVITIVDDQSGAPGPKPMGVTYEEFIAGGSREPIAHAAREDDTISVNYTSGTTGRPKGVMYSHRGAALNALGECLEHGLTSESVYLWTLPMFHCNGWCFTWALVAVGGTHVCLRRVDPPVIVRLIEQERVSHFCGAPAVLIMLTNHPSVKELKLTRPLQIVTAAAPPSPTILLTVEALGAKITHVYGLTETYGPHSVCEWHAEWNALPSDQRARMKARQGVPYLHISELRVVDDAMNDVPADGQTQGEVVMRGNNVMQGYYRDPAASAKAFAGGWFHSGDVGVVHADGYIELRDRKKDIIISGGENISTIEVEQAIYQHPAVLEVAVVAVPDDRWGEVPKAFVTLKPDATATADEIIAHCRAHLAHFKCPKSVEFIDLPKTSTGKIQKYVLRDKEWAGRDKRIN
ncbi:MAG: long-chain-fatty-acid--CoA ligase [Chloroflexi bacterium]|nr:long-chain-fatty-acid--CoA ligase [Chloroflexota bacterium]